MAELKKALALRFEDGESRTELLGLMLDRSDLDGALRMLGEALALEPATLYPRLRAAELLSDNGRGKEADEAYARALALAPDDPEPHEQLGRHRLRMGDDSGALAAFARALSLRPQNPALRELVRSVRPEERYATPYLYDAKVLAALSPLPGEDLEVLADLSVVKVFANGLSSRTRQLVLRALSPRGVDAARVQSVQYSPDRQVVKVERARILRKDGSVLESKSEGERNLSEPWYGLYYDVRARVISFPQLQPGDVLELITRTDDAGANFFADYFGDFAYLQGTQVRRISDYVLLGPPGRTFYANATPLKGLSHTEGKTADGGTFTRWKAKDVPKLVPEPSMPGASEVLAYVHVSTYKTWDDVGRFYWGLVKDQLHVTDDIRAAAGEAVKGIPASDEAARIRAVYDFVVSRTRYVGLEFGINSFKPYPVETILARRFGDCKDKASLMHAMLESLGIDSRLTLLRMKRLGAIEEAPASLAVFNHAILYIPAYHLFLDGTAEFHGSAELPGDDRGAEVLVVEPEGGSKFFRTPDATPADNFDETRISAKLQPDGSAAVQVKASARGSWTAELRRVFEPADERRARAEEQLARAAFPNVKVTEVDVSDPHDIEKPFETQITATAARFAYPKGSGLQFVPFGQRQSFVETYAQLSRRSLPQRLPLAQRTVIESEVELPAGWAATMPDGVRESGPQGAYEIGYESSGGKISARLTLTLNGGLLQPRDYAAFRAFLGRLDDALHRRVEAAPRAQTAAR
jgi:Tfp pilus assembly protein PilF